MRGLPGLEKMEGALCQPGSPAWLHGAGADPLTQLMMDFIIVVLLVYDLMRCLLDYDLMMTPAD